MEEWRRILAQSIVKPKDLADRFGLDEKDIEAVVGPYPMRITPTVLATIKEKGDAIWKQVVPELTELDDIDAEDDPLEEDVMSPVPHLVHRYPDRVLLMVTIGVRPDFTGVPIVQHANASATSAPATPAIASMLVC